MRFEIWDLLPINALAFVVLLASATSSDAQINFTPPPIPADEGVAMDSDGATPPPPPQEEEEVATPPPPPAEQFFVSIDGSSEGPFSMSELEARLAAGTFSATTYVWQEGMADWLRAGEVDKLDSLLESATDETDVGVEDNIETFLVGIWKDQNATNVPGLGRVQMDMLIEYYADGKMDAIGKFTSVNAGTTSVFDVYVEGTWSAESGSGNAFSVTTQARVSIGLEESPVYTDFFDIDETVTYERMGPDTFRDVENSLQYTRR